MYVNTKTVRRNKMADIVLKNVKLQWPSLDKVNDRGEFASHKYQVDIILEGDSLKTVEDNKSKKQKIKERDGVKSITVKSSVKPHVYDKSKRLLSDEEIQKIGNGTVAHVKLNKYTTKFGDFIGLGSVKVLDIKEYMGDDDFGDDDDVVPFDTDEDLI